MSEMTSCASATVDPDLAEQFLRMLDPEAERFHFRSFPERHGLTGKAKNHFCTLSEVPLLLAECANKGHGLFVVVNAGGHKDADINRVRAVYLDFDRKEFADDESYLAAVRFAASGRHASDDPRPPNWPKLSALIESGGGHHLYRLVGDCPVSSFKPVQQALAARFSADPSCVNPSRIMRLPGSLHMKGEPKLVKLTLCNPDQHFGTDDLLSRLGVEIRESAKIISGTTEAFVADHVGVRATTYLQNRRADLIRSVQANGRLNITCPNEPHRSGDHEGGTVWTPPGVSDDGGWGFKCSHASCVDYRTSAFLRWSGFDDETKARKAVTEGRGAPEVFDMRELLGRRFAPVQWAIQGLLPQGVSILSGDPKAGKSWLTLQMAVAITAGVPLWPGRQPETQGEVLLLALEDVERRLQSRTSKLLPRFGLSELPTGLHATINCHRAEAGVAWLREWLEQHPDCRLVVVDTIAAFRQSDLGKRSAYADDYAVGEMFKSLARDFNCAIVLVMHNRKMSAEDTQHMVSGTQGMTGGVDNVLVIRREKGITALHVNGRDIDEPCSLAINLDDGFWSSDGRTLEQAKMSTERRDILAALRSLGGCGAPKGVAEHVGRARSTVQKTMAKMATQGELEHSGGAYCLPTSTLDAFEKSS